MDYYIIMVDKLIVTQNVNAGRSRPLRQTGPYNLPRQSNISVAPATYERGRHWTVNRDAFGDKRRRNPTETSRVRSAALSLGIMEIDLGGRMGFQPRLHTIRRFASSYFADFRLQAKRK